MTKEEYQQKVWSFYLRLEDDFIDALNYVTLSESNYTTYSIEFERLILAICSEVDVLFKLLCKNISPEGNPQNVIEYFPLLSQLDGLVTATVVCTQTNEELSPFSEWSDTVRPSWWTQYNAIKHNRIDNDNFKLGNLKNTFFSLAALYVLNRFYCKQISNCEEKSEPLPQSSFFSMKGWPVYTPIGGGFYRIVAPGMGMTIKHVGQ